MVRRYVMFLVHGLISWRLGSKDACITKLMVKSLQIGRQVKSFEQMYLRSPMPQWRLRNFIMHAKLVFLMAKYVILHHSFPIKKKKKIYEQILNVYTAADVATWFYYQPYYE